MPLLPNLHFCLTSVDNGAQGGPTKKLNLSDAEKEALVVLMHTSTAQSVARDETFSEPFK